MSRIARPKPKTRHYNQSLPGVFGEFGSASNLHAFYVQSTISPEELTNKVKLVGQIPGSERWGVRDLFQREVDEERVTDSLIPYLRSDQIKFFNPLTLTLLPMQDTRVVSENLPVVKVYDAPENGDDWHCMERAPYYRMKHLVNAQQYAELEWNDSRCKLVAIDGQHRLSALKRIFEDYDNDEYFLNWRIPVVVVSFKESDNNTNPPTVLEVVRKIFVYINSTAKEINRQREILLSDESINSLATQELVQISHSNELQDNPDISKLSLLFFDWRGEERAGKPIASVSAFKPITEIHDWFSNYILGEDFDRQQKSMLGIRPRDTELNTFFVAKDKRLDHNASALIREKLHDHVLPSISKVLENFEPIKSYNSKLHELVSATDSDVHNHAVHNLKFGSNYANRTTQKKIMEKQKELEDQIKSLRDAHIQEPFSDDIGMRGVMSAFYLIRTFFGLPNDTLEYSEWFTEALNQAYNAKLFYPKLRKNSINVLEHVIVDQREQVINYRLHEANKAFGAYIALVVCAYGSENMKQLWDTQHSNFEQLCQDFTQTRIYELGETILRGYKKQVRAEIKDEYPDGGKPLTDAVTRKANQLRNKHLKVIEQLLVKISP